MKLKKRSNILQKLDTESRTVWFTSWSSHSSSVETWAAIIHTGFRVLVHSLGLLVLLCSLSSSRGCSGTYDARRTSSSEPVFVPAAVMTMTSGPKGPDPPTLGASHLLFPLWNVIYADGSWFRRQLHKHPFNAPNNSYIFRLNIHYTLQFYVFRVVTVILYPSLNCKREGRERICFAIRIYSFNFKDINWYLRKHILNE